jgi:hypothetical protein
VRSDAADSSRETVQMKGGQSTEVESKESQREGGMNEERRVQGQVDKGGFWWSREFFEQGLGDPERLIGRAGGCEEKV